MASARIQNLEDILNFSNPTEQEDQNVSVEGRDSTYLGCIEAIFEGDRDRDSPGDGGLARVQPLRMWGRGGSHNSITLAEGGEN